VQPDRVLDGAAGGARRDLLDDVQLASVSGFI
jgi:hypothetical protein